MITEDYAGFETAKLLKNKGFNEPCYACYLNKKLSHYDYLSTNFELIDDAISAPTLQMTMKWLREVHKLHIITIPYAPMDRTPHHPGEADVVYIAQIFRGIIPIDEVGRSIIKLSPEETIDAAIKYCLENLI